MVRWSRPARQDLREIHDFIAKDSDQYAKKVIREIVNSSAGIVLFPHKGRVVPELEVSSIRELFVYSYRLIYQINEGRIDILGVIHSKRDLSRIDFEGERL
jgi:toxin ParE1/3/4